MRLNQASLPASDLAASIAFYKALGFVLIVSTDHYARLEYPDDQSTLSLMANRTTQDGAHLYYECDDLDAFVAALKSKGVTFDSGPEDKDWLWREAWLSDPAGNKLCLYHAGKNRRFPPWRIG